MARLFKNIILTYFGLMIFILIMNAFINSVTRKDKKNYINYVTTVSQEKEAPSTKRRYPLKPVDPKTYGMMVVTQTDLPRSQMESDIFVDKIVKESGVLDEHRVVSKLKDLKISPEDYQQRISDLDGRITVYKTKKENDPSDKAAEEKLYQIYLLKSVQMSLKGRTTGQETAPAPNPEPPSNEAAPAPNPAAPSEESEPPAP